MLGFATTGNCRCGSTVACDSSQSDRSRRRPEEIAASESSLALAPAIAARVTCVHQMWTDREWAERAVTKPKAFSLKRVELTDELRDDISEDEW